MYYTHRRRRNYHNSLGTKGEAILVSALSVLVAGSILLVASGFLDAINKEARSKCLIKHSVETCEYYLR